METISLQTNAAQNQTSKMTNYRWVIIALSFFIIVVNYMDRSAISYAIGPLKKEFALTNEQFGYIAAAFGIGYMIMTLGGGIIVDLWGSRKVWAISAIAWSAITALLGLSSGFWHLFFLRAMLGITEGPCFPALTRVVTDWLPMTERARSTAFGLAAVPFASVIGAPLISYLILLAGWKIMFFILGSLGIIWAIAWYFLFADYPENSKHVSQKELSYIQDGKTVKHGISDSEIRKIKLKEGTTTWKFMLFNPSLAANNYAFFSFGYLLFFAVTWLPGYLEQTYAVKLKELGYLLIAPWLTAAVLVVVAGFLCDWLWKKTGSIRISRSHPIWICQLLSACCFGLVTVVHSLPTALILISLGVGIGLMPNAAFYVINSDLAKDRAATSLGLMDCFLALAGILAPSLTGILSTVSGNFNSAIWLMSGFTITSVLGILLFQHPDKYQKQQ
jgi:MFS family permease